MGVHSAVRSDRARTVTWELTRACKLSCLHCPIGSQQRRSQLELSTYEAYKTLDQIASLAPDELILTGGDALERSDIYELLDYARRRGLKPSLMVSATPSLTGASIGKLRRSGLGRLVVPIDSAVPDRHDSARGINGQFSATLLAVRWARTAELPVEANTLITRSNARDLPRIAELLADLKVQRWNVYFAVPIGKSRTIDQIQPAEAEEVYATLYRLSGKLPFALRTFEAPQYRRFVVQKAIESARRSVEELFDETVEKLADTDPVHDAAIDASDFIFISHTGEVSVSAFLPMTAGNVRYQPLASVYRAGELFVTLRDRTNLKGKCARCEFRTICGGSRARAFALTGDLFASDSLCAYEPGSALAAAPTVVRRDRVPG